MLVRMEQPSGKVRLRKLADRKAATLALSAKIVEGVPDVLVVDVDGTIGNATVGEFQGFFDGVLREEKFRRVVLDLSKLADIGSMGLAYLSMLRDRLTELVLVGVEGKVRIVMKMLGFLGVFREFAKKEQALRALLLPKR